MNIKDLKEKLKSCNINISDKEICNIWGMDTASFSRKKTAGTEIKFKNLQQLEEKLNINITGSYKIKIHKEETITANYYPNIEISCGNGCFSMNEAKEKILIPLKAISEYSNTANYIVVKAVSDSMMPELKPNDLLVVEQYKGEHIKDNHIYIFVYDDCLYCKYLSKNLGQIIVRSANPVYPTRFIEKDELNKFYILGEVKGHIRDYTTSK